MSINILVFLIIFFVFSFVVFPPYIKTSSNSMSYSNSYYYYAFIMFYVFFIIFYISRKLFLGYDTFAYVSVFKTIVPCSSFQEISNKHIAMGWEKGFVWLVYLISRLSSSKFFFLFVIGGLLYFSFLLFFFRKTKRFLISVFVFVFSGLFFSTTNLMRQYLAVAIILFGYNFLLKKKYIHYFFIVYIASLFHLTSLICIVLPVISKIKLSRKNVFVYLSFIIILILFGNTILSLTINSLVPQYGWYLTSSMYGLQNTVKLGSLLNFLIQLFVFFLFYTNYDSRNYEYSVLLKLYMIGLLFTATSIKFTQIGRLTGYFTPTMLLLFYKTKKNGLYYMTLIVLLIYCIIVNIFRPEWTGFFPYYLDF